MSNVYNNPMTPAREWTRVDCATYGTAPDSQTDAPDPTADGVYQLTEALDPILGSHTGVNPTVLVAPVSPSASGWTLRVFGAKPVRGALGAITGWLWVALMKGDVTVQSAAVATAVAGALAADENLASAVGVTFGNEGVDVQTTDTADGEGAATFRLDTRGCHFLWFQGAADTAVLVSRL